MTPGCDSRGRNDVRGRGGPSGGRRWAGCGSPTSPTMQSSMAPSQVVLGGRKVAIRRPRVRRAGAELRIQRGAWRSTTRRSSSMPGSVYGRSCKPGVDHAHQLVGRWQGSIPVSDALWAQRLTPSPAPGRHVAPAGAGPRAPRVMVSFCDVGSAAAPREVLEAAYSGTCRAPSRNPTLRGPDD